MKQLTESEFKTAIRNYFKGLATNWKEEFHSKEEVCSYYDSNVRFDLAIVIYPKNLDNWKGLRLIGIEIKTNKDTFKRLAQQLPAYVRVFDKVYIAVQTKEIPEQIPQFIGVIRINEKKEITIERESQIQGSDFNDYCNNFIFKRGLAELGFKITEKDSRRLEALLNAIYGIRKKFIANTFFGSRVLDCTNQNEMKFTIPLAGQEKEMLKSIFASRQTYLEEKKKK